MPETTEPDGPLLKEFKGVHAVIRRDITRCRDLAKSVTNGAPPEAIRQQVGQLQTKGVIFQLRVNCLQACGFVNLHHRGEDSLLFPSVRRTAPELSWVVDRLENDHKLVSDMLDEVEAATESATDAAADQIAIAAGRKRLVEALETLIGHLFEHLDFEEKMLAPVISSWKRWPFYA